MGVAWSRHDLSVCLYGLNGCVYGLSVSRRQRVGLGGMVLVGCLGYCTALVNVA